jgi:hypothetical protein
MVQDMALIRRWAIRYYEMGLNPLPSCGHAKKPALRGPAIERYRDRDRIPEEWLRRWWAPNIQIPLGVRWGFCVVDIDSREAFAAWVKMIRGRFETWVSAAPLLVGRQRDFSGRRHLWFRIPESVESLATVVLWRGQSGQEIKLLSDRALVIAPPSIHPERQTRYEWLVGPEAWLEPALMPRWLLDRARSIRDHSVVSSSARPHHRPFPSGPRSGRHHQRDEVLYALGNRKLEIAGRYGLQFKRYPNPAGFHECRSVDREDQHWSCTFDPRTGVYHDFATGEVLSFFDVLMRLAPGEFSSFKETVDRLCSYIFGDRS